ncbi:CPD photolyase isoform X3 [Polyodon spathula]|uniref:CPD photolyase isoform X3 n=1 Tax=Polyodon spathula TaxID=7913 RepID=UPI001B7E9933|nr:CPD photolyase isoform X3 [Polyodon spathula]
MEEKPGKLRKTKNDNGNTGAGRVLDTVKIDQKVVEGGRQAGSSSGREAKAARKQEPGKRESAGETTRSGSSGDELSNTGTRKKRRLGARDVVASPPGGVGGLASSIKETRLQARMSVQGFEFNKKRVRLISEAVEMKDGSESIVYWMSRDQRVQDNWALLYSQHLALSHELPLHVCFCLVPRFLDATIRHFGFMLRGLEEVAKAVDWEQARSSLEVDCSVKEVDWARPGTEAGLAMLESFIMERLKLFGSDRNNPNRPALSNLSPWFHFGQVSVQRAVLEVRKCSSKYLQSVNSFIEEAVVRRELADNFCYYNKNYDCVEGASDWARKTLQDHAQDERSHLYSRAQLEAGKTHDPLWNAAQLQMTLEGKMHGFLRMYWAKKILEWTSSPEEALETALYLNDRYELDGRDPNGYVGCMWSICGIHDQGWGERPVFGKIRFMNYAGCKRKFDVGQFERKYHPEKFTV